MVTEHSRVLEETLSAEQFELLAHGDDAQKDEYIQRVLSPEQIALVSDRRDLICIALVESIARTDSAQLKRFDRYSAVNGHQKAYILDSARWMAGEEYLLGLALKRAPSSEEIVQDFEARDLGLRHRAFYVLRYPDKVAKFEEIDLRASVVA